MDSEHLSCPQCDYDLYGIPELRCPECGFRFDRAALKDLAACADWQRWAVARDVIVRTGWAVPLAIASIAGGPWMPGPTLVVLCFAAYIAAFIVWVVLTGGWQPQQAPTPLSVRFFVGLFGLAYLVFIFPGLAVYVAAIPLGSAAVTRLYFWPKLAPEANVSDSSLRQSVARHSVVADFVLLGTVMVWLVALVC